MANASEKNENNSPSLIGAGVFSKRIKIVLIIIIAILAVLAALLYAGAQVYAGSIGPGVKIGPFKVGGMDIEQARTLIHDKADTLLEQGLTVSYEGKSVTVPLSSVGTADPDVSQDYISFKIDSAVEEAYERSHSDNIISDMLKLVSVTVWRPTINIEIAINEDQILQEIITQIPALAKPPVNSRFSISPLGNSWDVQVTKSEPGTVIEDELFFTALENMMKNFASQPIEIRATFSEPEIDETKAEAYISAAKTVLDRASYTLTYEKQDLEWKLTATEIAGALMPVVTENGIRLGLQEDKIHNFLDTIANDVEVEAQDARFEMENGRVKSFVGSQSGITLLRKETIDVISSMWEQGEKSAEIVVEIVEPRVTTDKVNDLGINEILGIGTSDFSGSPYNRILNIEHGASKLNGILIAPDEEFSLLNALKPFTIEDGYRSELVIKGDEIKPEVGGGLCQIGTTTFRAAMNSGLPITERSNHSLVVSYYNDPSNGNPGTDATIYDPAPDLRFLNDTGNYILFTTDVDLDNHILTFTFWGTSDGRKGYYSAPVVTGWIDPGETQYVETEDLEPGEERCQAKHWGANANFTYYIERPDGTLDETLYSSHYRALPEICLVGIDPDAEKTEDREEMSEDEITNTSETLDTSETS